MMMRTRIKRRILIVDIASRLFPYKQDARLKAQAPSIKTIRLIWQSEETRFRLNDNQIINES